MSKIDIGTLETASQNSNSSSHMRGHCNGVRWRQTGEPCGGKSLRGLCWGTKGNDRHSPSPVHDERGFPLPV